MKLCEASICKRLRLKVFFLNLTGKIPIIDFNHLVEAQFLVFSEAQFLNCDFILNHFYKFGKNQTCISSFRWAHISINENWFVVCKCTSCDFE